jgi:Sugar phosphate permease
MAQAIDTVHAPSKIRWLLLGIVFMSCLIAYLDRVNLSVCATFIMEDMKFDRVQLGYAMSAFFAAYALTQIPGGILAERWGIRKNGAFAMFWWSLFTFLTPHAWGFASFLVVRFLFGLGEGPLYPNNGFFFAKWFSSKEKAIANSWMSAGTLLGPALGPPLTVFLVTHTSWHWAFYVFGFAGFIATALWWIYARDTPAEHPKINDAELLIITEQTNVQDAVSEASKKIKTPWGKFLKNHRFWAIGFQYMANNYITFLFMSWVPLYLQQSRGVSFTQMGALAGLPFLAAAISTVLTSILSDKLVRMGKSKMLTRSAFGFFGMTGQTNISNPLINRANNLPVCVISTPIIREGKITGALIVGIDLSPFTENMIAPIKIGEKGYVYLVDGNGITVSHPDAAQIMKLDISRFEWGRKMLSTGNGSTEYLFDGHGKTAVYAKVKSTGWIVCAIVSEDDTTAVARVIWTSSMLTSCASGVTVVNIDNGFGAACAACRIANA